MADYSITTSAVQEVALSLIVADVNERAALAKSPPITVSQYLLARIGDLLQSYSIQMGPRILFQAAQIYPTLSEPQRTTILADLGRSSFGALPLPDQVAALQALALSDFVALPVANQTSILQTLGLVPTGA